MLLNKPLFINQAGATKRLFILFAAFFLTAIQAQAAFYSQTQEFNNIPNFSSLWAFNKFNSSLGNLTSINISFTLKSTNGVLKLDNDGAAGIDSTFEFGAAGLIYSTDVEMKNSSSESIFSQIKACHSQPFHLDPNPDEFIYTGVEETAFASGSVGNAFWNGFTGANTFNICYLVTLVSDLNPSNDINIFCSRPGAYGSVTVTYGYDAVPEPAAFLSFSLGTMLIFARKKP